MGAINNLNLFYNFLFELYGEEVKEAKEVNKKGQLISTTYSCTVPNSVRVITDTYGGCHLDFPENAAIPENFKSLAVELSKMLAHGKQCDSLWFDFSLPTSGATFSLIPNYWVLGDATKGNIINDIQTNPQKVRVWQWLNPDKECKIPPGATHNMGAVAAVIDSVQQKILLVQNSSRKRSWNMPGGSYDPHVDSRSSTQKTAERECFEETGIDVKDKPVELIGQMGFAKNQFAPSLNQVWKFVFDNGSQIVPKPQPGEILRAEWVSFEDVLKGVYSGLEIGLEIQSAIAAHVGFSLVPGCDKDSKPFFFNPPVARM